MKVLSVSKKASSGNKFAALALQTIAPAWTTTIPDNHVVVEMVASRINPVDADLVSQQMPFLTSVKNPQVSPQLGGVDGAGVIVGLGKQEQQQQPAESASSTSARTLEIGDKVLIYSDFTNFGTWGQQACVPTAFCTPAPEALALPDTGAAALTATTAYDSLYRALDIEQDKENKTILILGGAGGVGFCAVQMAVNSGLKVYSTAGSEGSVAKLQAAGVHRVINYKTEDVVQVMMQEQKDNNIKLDYVFDVAGKDPSLSTIITKLQPTKLCSLHHPNADAMANVGIDNLSGLWRTLFGALTWWTNRTARGNGVQLIGQVTPSANRFGAMAGAAKKMNEISKFKVEYKTIKFSDIQARATAGESCLTEKDMGKVILFQE